MDFFFLSSRCFWVCTDPTTPRHIWIVFSEVHPQTLTSDLRNKAVGLGQISPVSLSRAGTRAVEVNTDLTDRLCVFNLSCDPHGSFLKGKQPSTRLHWTGLNHSTNQNISQVLKTTYCYIISYINTSDFS